MHLAYLILAHKNPDQLKRLITRLNNEFTSIFIHLDKKTDDRQTFYDIANSFKNVYFIKQQVAVNWGAFSMVEATLNSLSEILEYDRTFDYINLLSGMDYPIKNNEDIYNFFLKNSSREFLYYRETPSPDLPLGGRDRYEYYYSYDSEISNKNEYEIEMKTRGIKRKFIDGVKPYHGTQWWSLTGGCVDHVLKYINENMEFINYYRYTKFPDEQFFQTAVMNSKYAGNVTNDSLRHIDWSQNNWLTIDWTINQPHPKTFTLSDFNQLKQSPKLYARKFDESIDKVILNNIDHMILRYKPGGLTSNSIR